MRNLAVVSVLLFLSPAIAPSQRLPFHSPTRARANYFLGADPAGWLRDQPIPARRQVTQPETVIGSGVPTVSYSTFLGGSQREHVCETATDPQGNIYVAGTTTSPDFPLTAHAWTASIPANSTFAFVAKFASSGALAWSTYLGPVLAANGATPNVWLAVDRYGNSFVAGVAAPNTFPTTKGAMIESSTAFKGTNSALFVSKLNTAGNALLYSTLLGSGSNALDMVGGIAVDSGGHAFITGVNSSPEFRTTSGAALIRYPVGSFAAELSPAGTHYIYATGLNSTSDRPAGIALDVSGDVIVTGSTLDKSIRTAGSLQSSQATRQLSRTTDNGATWKSISAGLPVDSTTLALAVDPQNGGTVYAGGTGGLFRSTDGGDTWNQISGMLFASITVDPRDSQHILGVVGGGYVWTRDGGLNWHTTGWGVSNVVFDPRDPLTVYAASGTALYYSRDGGDTLQFSFLGQSSGGAFDWRRPSIDNVSGLVYSGIGRGLAVSVDKGANWRLIANLPITYTAVASDGLYLITGLSLAKSTDQGFTLKYLQLPGSATDLVMDPTDEKTLYVMTTGKLYQTADGGATFNAPATQPPGGATIALGFDTQHPGTRFALTANTTDVFVTRISADGSSIPFSTYFGGAGSESASAVAAGPGGDIYIAGTTQSLDLPASLNTSAGNNEAFLARISGDGKQLRWSRYFGGTGADAIFALATDVTGNAIVAGSTSSTDIPVTPDAPQPMNTGQRSTPVMGLYGRFDGNGSLKSASYIGGSNGDAANAIAIDAAGRVCIAGDTNSADLPVSPNAAQPAHNGLTDAFLMVLTYQ